MRTRPNAEVAEFIQYFDHQRFLSVPIQERFGLLTKKEFRFIKSEVEMCQKSFEYAARNYFWITSKKGIDVLLDLVESQHLILEKLAWLRSKGRPQKLFVLKARQLGCSTLIEARIAWRTMFYPNVNAMVVSHNEDHSAKLFGMVLHIYDQLPWWLKPMLATRKYEEGLHFMNPDPEQRRQHPGLNSMISVQAATQLTGVGQGLRLSAVHASEISDWYPLKAKQIIDGDMVHALAEEDPEMFAIIETTGKGAGTYTEDLWLSCIELGERADWYPLFTPFFFERSRFLAPERGWKPEDPEIGMRGRVEREWVRCTNESCGHFYERWFRGEDRADSDCPECKMSTLRPYKLSDGQLCWIWERRLNAESRGVESLKELKQEMCSTPEESFQLRGIQVFPSDTHAWVNETIGPPIAIGNIDEKGYFHCFDSRKKDQEYTCYQSWCKADHRYEADQPMEIWEWPEEKCSYAIGVDVSEGMEEDYSVVWVNRLGAGGSPDVQVAMFRSNTIDAYAFAGPVNYIGRWYNDALMSIEHNYPTTAEQVQNFYAYPNLYRWKHLDSATNILSNKWHWQTQINTKSKLWQTAIAWLRARAWVVRSSVFAHEMKRFNKEFSDSKKASAAPGFHDDVCMAAMICLHCSHDIDSDLGGGHLPVHPESGILNVHPWQMTCRKCGHQWGADNPEHERCHRCRCILVSGKPNGNRDLRDSSQPYDMGNPESAMDSKGQYEYDSL